MNLSDPVCLNLRNRSIGIWYKFMSTVNINGKDYVPIQGADHCNTQYWCKDIGIGH